MKPKYIANLIIMTLTLLFLSPNPASASLITLDEIWLGENSTTTRIDQMSKEELKSVESLVLENVKAGNKVEFTSNLDFSSDSAIEQLNSLSDNTDFTTSGKISINLEKLPSLNSAAKVTMTKLPFKQTPLIYKDGSLVTIEDVSNIVYIYSQSNGGTLTFDVTSFSVYEARDRNAARVISNSNNTTISSSNNQNNTLYKSLIIILLIILEGLAVVVMAKWIKDKRQR